jgi:hypothetical protein
VSTATTTIRRRFALPAELRPDQVTAVVDSREQRPLDLAPLRTVPGTLTTGDYSVCGLEHVVAIERKGLSDLLSCIGGERARFEREIARLLGWIAGGLPVVMAGDHARAGRYVSRLLYTAARRRWREARALAGRIGHQDDQEGDAAP